MNFKEIFQYHNAADHHDHKFISVSIKHKYRFFVLCFFRLTKNCNAEVKFRQNS